MTAEQPECLDGVDGLCQGTANSEITQLLPPIRVGPQRKGVLGRRKVRPGPAEKALDAVPQPAQQRAKKLRQIPSLASLLAWR